MVHVFGILHGHGCTISTPCIISQIECYKWAGMFYSGAIGGHKSIQELYVTYDITLLT